MTIIREDGVNRHIRFQRPGTMCMHFDIITWPGYLAYVGDMGCFTFFRLEDMMNFFRSDNNGIDFRYWAEKCVSVDRSDGLKKFSPTAFGESVYESFVDWCESREHLTEEEVSALAVELQDALYESGDDEWSAVTMIREFSCDVSERYGEFTFVDFFDRGINEYSFRFVWCCYALRWAVQQYDRQKELVV